MANRKGTVRLPFRSGDKDPRRKPGPAKRVEVPQKSYEAAKRLGTKLYEDGSYRTPARPKSMPRPLKRR